MLKARTEAPLPPWLVRIVCACARLSGADDFRPPTRSRAPARSQLHTGAHAPKHTCTRARTHAFAHKRARAPHTQTHSHPSTHSHGAGRDEAEFAAASVLLIGESGQPLTRRALSFDADGDTDADADGDGDIDEPIVRDWADDVALFASGAGGDAGGGGEMLALCLGSWASVRRPVAPSSSAAVRRSWLRGHKLINAAGFSALGFKGLRA